MTRNERKGENANSHSLRREEEGGPVLWKSLQRCWVLEMLEIADVVTIHPPSQALILFATPIHTYRAPLTKAHNLNVLVYHHFIFIELCTLISTIWIPPTLCLFTHKPPVGPSIQVKSTRNINPSMQCMWKH
jgi:hypothetical protein